MNFNESLRTALDSLAANRMRALLTMLGVIIGVASVIALLALGEGFSASIEDDITSIGTNLIFINTDLDNSDGYQALSMDDVDALLDKSRAPDVADVTAVVGSMEEVLGNGRNFNGTVQGVTGSYFSINNMLDSFWGGESFTFTDEDSRARVAILGWEVAHDLFDTPLAMGETIKINGVSYEVIGVLEESGGGVGGSTDEIVFIPLSTAQSRLGIGRTRTGKLAVSSITAQGASSDTSEEALAQIATILREEHDIAYASEDDFTLLSQGDLLDTVGEVLGLVTLFLGAVAAISLLVGGIGIMNIMLVSVTERTREIGIRKAMGALRRDVLLQFLIESLILSLLGGFIGIVLGWIIGVVGGRYIDLTAVFTANSIALSVGFSLAVGVLFGIYPAWRAANLRVIDALRYE